MPSLSPHRPTAFTLVEVALALAIMGLIGAMTFPLLSHFLNQQKVVRTETILETARSEAQGYAMNSLALPGSIEDFGHQFDAWRTELVYLQSDITGLCDFFDGNESANLLDLVLHQGRTISDVAFVLLSTGRNKIQETEYDPVAREITAPAPGESDDLLVYMTTDFLRSKVWERCPVAAGD